MGAIEMRALGMMVLCVFLIAVPQASRAAEASTQPSASREKQPNITEAKDIDFMLRFEQAIRDDDKTWIAENTRENFGIIVDGKLRRYKSKAAIIRHFDEIYRPWVKSGILTAELEDIRSPNGLLFVFGRGPTSVLVTILPYCYPDPDCKHEIYEINSITYETPPEAKKGPPGPSRSPNPNR